MEQLGIEFEIENPKMISINEQYLHPVKKTKTGRYVSYFCASPLLKELQEFYKEILQEKIPDSFVEQLKQIIIDKSDGISLELEIGMPESEILEWDISNFVKAIEDCIVKRMGIDDNRHYYVTAKKTIYESETKAWILKVLYHTTTLEKYSHLNDQIVPN